ncbi:MAG TPA: hypothetical protein PKK99_10890 [Bacteroidia bacterium]|nr:hypothetical protein [Bacteroidia bacterium]
MNGSYDLEGVIWHQHSNKLMVKILELWPDKGVPVKDLGCGHNFYCNVLRYAGYDAEGYDATVLNKSINIIDLTRPIQPGYIGPKFNTISLEVGEHLPSEFENIYLDNLTVGGLDIIMSWALPGQAGVGHINCQSNEWVISRMYDRGYILDHDKTRELRIAVNGCHCTWFQNTLMYFKPKQK